MTEIEIEGLIHTVRFREEVRAASLEERNEVIFSLRRQLALVAKSQYIAHNRDRSTACECMACAVSLNVLWSHDSKWFDEEEGLPALTINRKNFTRAALISIAAQALGVSEDKIRGII